MLWAARFQGSGQDFSLFAFRTPGGNRRPRASCSCVELAAASCTGAGSIMPAACRSATSIVTTANAGSEEVAVSIQSVCAAGSIAK